MVEYKVNESFYDYNDYDDYADDYFYINHDDLLCGVCKTE